MKTIMISKVQFTTELKGKSPRNPKKHNETIPLKKMAKKFFFSVGSYLVQQKNHFFTKKANFSKQKYHCLLKRSQNIFIFATNDHRKILFLLAPKTFNSYYLQKSPKTLFSVRSAEQGRHSADQSTAPIRPQTSTKGRTVAKFPFLHPRLYAQVAVQLLLDLSTQLSGQA